MLARAFSNDDFTASESAPAAPARAAAGAGDKLGGAGGGDSMVESSVGGDGASCSRGRQSQSHDLMRSVRIITNETYMERQQWNILPGGMCMGD